MFVVFDPIKAIFKRMNH